MTFWLIATIVAATAVVVITIALATLAICERLEGLIKLGLRRE